MLKKWMVVVALVAFGCGEEKTGDNTPNDSDKPSGTVKDASTRDARGSSNNQGDEEETEEDASTGSTGNDGDAVVMPGNDAPPAIDDAGSIEVKTPDGGTVVITPGQDGGAVLSGMGSCCSAHDTAGCNNADLMVCVCEKNAKCCTSAWTLDCALIVTQRYCQEGVRDCVADQWGKPECKVDWTSSCDTIGISKCEQVPGCF